MHQIGLRHGSVGVEVEQHDLVGRSDSRLVQELGSQPCVGTDDLKQQ